METFAIDYGMRQDNLFEVWALLLEACNKMNQRENALYLFGNIAKFLEDFFVMM